MSLVVSEFETSNTAAKNRNTYRIEIPVGRRWQFNTANPESSPAQKLTGGSNGSCFLLRSLPRNITSDRGESLVFLRSRRSFPGGRIKTQVADSRHTLFTNHRQSRWNEEGP